MMKMTFGIIYPLPLQIAYRILQDKKSVFVKYPIHDTIPPNLLSCRKLLLYISRSNKEIAGECDILLINLMTISEAVSKYGDKLFLTEEELIKYSNGRCDKNMLVIELGNIIKYSEPRYLGHGITMAGEYISKENYDILVS